MMPNQTLRGPEWPCQEAATGPANPIQHILRAGFMGLTETVLGCVGWPEGRPQRRATAPRSSDDLTAEPSLR